MTSPRKAITSAAVSMATFALLVAAPTVSARVPAPSRTSPRVTLAAGPVSSILIEDKGKFRDLVKGQPVGEEEFQIAPNGNDWVARATATVRAGQGPATHITSLLRMRPDGTPLHYEWATTGAKKASATVDFENGTATIQLHLGNSKPFTQQFFFKTSRVVVLDDNLYHQYSILASLYNWQKKGAQTFAVLVPQEMTPGSVTAEALDPEDAGGKSLERLRVHSQDLEITLYLEGRRLVRIAVPSANAEIVRQ